MKKNIKKDYRTVLAVLLTMLMVASGFGSAFVINPDVNTIDENLNFASNDGDIIDEKIPNSLNWQYLIDEYNDGESDYWCTITGTEPYAFKYSQSFQADMPKLYLFTLELHRIGTTGGGELLFGQIYNDNNGKPGNPIGNSSFHAAHVIPTTPETFWPFSISPPLLTTPGETYHIVVWGVNFAGSSMQINFHLSSTNTYPRGNRAWSDDWGATWNTVSHEDMGFVVFGQWPPGDPSNLNAFNPTTNSIDLTWNVGGGLYSHTVIRRKTSSYPSSPYDGVHVYNDIGTSTTDTGLNSGTKYYYRAWGYHDGTYLFSNQSSQDFEYTLPGNPGNPSNLDAYNPTSSSIQLSWTTGSGSDYTMIRRKTGSYPTSPSDGSQAYYGTGTSTTDTGLNAGQRYYYRAWAYDSGSGYYSSGYSSDNEYTKPGNPPNLNAEATSSNTIDLTWIKGTGSDKTMIRRSTGSYPSSPSSGTQVYFGTGTSTTDSGLNPSTTYYYRAWAYDSDSTYYSDVYAQDTATTFGDNGPPNKPDPPDGQTSGVIDDSYDYSASTIDPEGDNIYYKFDWGDESYSNWLGPYGSGATVTESNSWNAVGTYNVRVKAKDTHNDESDWSEPLEVTIISERDIWCLLVATADHKGSDNDGDRYNNAIWEVYNALRDVGIPADHIRAYGFSYETIGIGNSPPPTTMSGKSTPTDVDAGLDWLASKSTSSDYIFFCFMDHGIKEKLCLSNGLIDSEMTSSHLNDKLNSISYDKAIILLGQCFSGSFITNTAGSISASNRIIITAVSDSTYGFSMEALPKHDASDGTSYDPTLRYFAQAIKGDGDGNSDNVVTMKEAFDYMRNQEANDDLPTTGDSGRDHNWLDDNGDKKFDSNDGAIASGVSLGPYAGDAPSLNCYVSSDVDGTVFPSYNVSFEITVTNSGSQYLNDATIFYMIGQLEDQDFTCLEKQSRSVDIASGESKDISVSWTASDSGEFSILIDLFWNDDFLDNKMYDFTVEETTPTPDLSCDGDLTWTNVGPGSTVTGTISIQNVGDSGTELDWAITEDPSWGTWSFDPKSGEDLTPEDGLLTVDVSVVAPNEKGKTYTGKVKIVNTHDPENDNCELDTSLKTKSGCCFPAGTKITMVDGSLKNIEEVRVGDRVSSYDMKRGRFTSWMVKMLGNPVHPVYEINNGLIRATIEHPFYIKKSDGRTGWGALDSGQAEKFTMLRGNVLTLEVGDKLLTSDKEWIEVASIDGPSDPIQTYNILSFSGTKTYFANGILVYEEHPPFAMTNYFLDLLLERFPNMFPILQYMLGLWTT